MPWLRRPGSVERRDCYTSIGKDLTSEGDELDELANLIQPLCREPLAQAVEDVSCDLLDLFVATGEAVGPVGAAGGDDCAAGG